MKHWASTRYRCPLSGGALSLRVLEEEYIELDRDQCDLLDRLNLPIAPFQRQVKSGFFVAGDSKYWFPIIDYVPVLLDFDNHLYDVFESQNAEHRSLWTGLKRANRKPRAGEAMTQRSFTTEWQALEEDDELTFTYTHDERRAFIEMEFRLAHKKALDRDFVVLDVGCGSGLEGLFISQVVERPVFAIDINMSLLRNGARLKSHALVNNAIASVFAPPFEPGSFSFGYSHGVLHHTYNTHRALQSLMRFLKPDANIYIWVYALEDAQRARLGRKLGYIAELLFRPRIAAAPEWLRRPLVDALALRHFLRYRRNGLKRDHWRFRHSVHSMRDRWTCRYAHRHSFHEVIGWFLAGGYSYKLLDPVAYREAFKRNLIGIGISGTPRR